MRRATRGAPGGAEDAALLAIAFAAYGAGDTRHAESLLEALDNRRERGLDLQSGARGPRLDARMGPRGRSATERPGAAANRRPAFAVMDYKQPDRLRTSSNLGDYVQTLASIGHIARHQGIEFDRSSRLGEFMARMQDRVPANRRIGGPPTPVEFVAVNRDGSFDDPIPPGTWMLAFGWYIHSIFDKRFGFPYHPNLRPLFISFHVGRREMLTDEAIAFLRRYEPIGCRDWTTVYLLHSVGVSAFFSGLHHDDGRRRSSPEMGHYPGARGPLPVAFVDTPIAPDALDGEEGVSVTQATADVRDGDLVSNLGRRGRAPREVPAGLRAHRHVPPARVPAGDVARRWSVDFRPRNPADVRFDGLLGLSPGRPR